MSALALIVAATLAQSSALRTDLAVRGGGGVKVRWYVDSVNGDDANTGRSPANALKTIAALATKPIKTNQTIYLARGSLWREYLDLSSTGLNVAANVRAYGTGDRPVLAGDDVASNAAFSKTGGRTNVYQIAWSTDGVAGTVRHCVWENGTRLKRVADVATVDSTPGSFYAPDPTAGPDTIYIHPVGSTDPTSNGKTYELSKRVSALRANIYGGSLYSIEGRRTTSTPVFSYTYGEDIVGREGKWHNIWFEGTCRNCQAIEAEPPPGYGGGTLFISFPSTVGGASRPAICDGCSVVDSGGPVTGLLGFYAHTDGGSNYSAIVYRNCTVDGTQTAFGVANTAKILIDGAIVKNATAGVSIASVPRVDILNSTFCDGGVAKMQMAANIGQFDVSNFIGNRVIAKNNANLGYVVAIPNAGGDGQFWNNTFTSDGSAGWYWTAFYDSRGAAGATSTFSRNVMQGMNYAYNISAQPGWVADYNLFPSALTLYWGGSGYTWANYLTASSQDAHTVLSAPLVTASATACTLTTSGSSPAVALEAGADNISAAVQYTMAQIRAVYP